MRLLWNKDSGGLETRGLMTEAGRMALIRTVDRTSHADGEANRRPSSVG